MAALPALLNRSPRRREGSGREEVAGSARGEGEEPHSRPPQPPLVQPAKPCWRQGQQERFEAARAAWHASRRREVEQARRERQSQLCDPPPPKPSERAGNRASSETKADIIAHREEQARRRGEAERCWRKAAAAERAAVRRERQAQLRALGLPPRVQACEGSPGDKRVKTVTEKIGLRRGEESRLRETVTREAEAATQRHAQARVRRQTEEHERKEAAAASEAASAAAAARSAAVEEERLFQAAAARAEEKELRERQARPLPAVR